MDCGYGGCGRGRGRGGGGGQLAGGGVRVGEPGGGWLGGWLRLHGVLADG